MLAYTPKGIVCDVENALGYFENKYEKWKCE